MWLNCVHRFKSALLTDKRVRIMNEIISGIRVIKMYAWENAFKRVVARLRRYVVQSNNYMYSIDHICVHYIAGLSTGWRPGLVDPDHRFVLLTITRI